MIKFSRLKLAKSQAIACIHKFIEYFQEIKRNDNPLVIIFFISFCWMLFNIIHTVYVPFVLQTITNSHFGRYSTPSLSVQVRPAKMKNEIEENLCTECELIYLNT